MDCNELCFDFIYFYFIHLQQQPTVYIEDGQRKLHKIFPFNIKVSTSISRITIGVFLSFLKCYKVLISQLKHILNKSENTIPELFAIYLQNEASQ